MKIAVVLDARLRLSPRPQANPRLCGDARGRDGSVREELATGVTMGDPKVERRLDHGSLSKSGGRGRCPQ